MWRWKMKDGGERSSSGDEWGVEKMREARRRWGKKVISDLRERNWKKVRERESKES